jgi:hypothetical protein
MRELNERWARAGARGGTGEAPRRVPKAKTRTYGSDVLGAKEHSEVVNLARRMPRSDERTLLFLIASLSVTIRRGFVKVPWVRFNRYVLDLFGE